MDVSFSGDNTELCLAFQGKGAAQHRAALARSAACAPSSIIGMMHVSVPLSLGGNVAMCVVNSYKHLGSSIADDCGLKLEAQHRSKSVMSAYSPLAGSLFRARGVSTRVKLVLAHSFAFARLLYNVHTWSTSTGRHRTIISKVYDTVLQKNSRTPTYNRMAPSDLDIRINLGVDSMDCLVRTQRLKYMPRVLSASLSLLLAVLQGHNGGNVRPWVNTIMQDFKVLFAALPCTFSAVAPPWVDPVPLFKLICAYPREWKPSISNYHTSHNDIHIGSQCPVFPEPAGPLGPMPWTDGSTTAASVFVCSMCSAKPFMSKKALDQHARIKHGMRAPWLQLIPDISFCPVCHTNLHSGTRLVSHLSETRVRSTTRRTTCQAEFLRHHVRPVSASDVAALSAQLGRARANARAGGLTHERAVEPASRGAPSILKGRGRATVARGLPKRRLRANRQ